MNPIEAVSDLVATVNEMGSGRKHRRVWASVGRAHIEVRSVHLPGQQSLARAVEDGLNRVSGVKWAQVNAITGRVVVVFDPEGPNLDDLIGVVDAVEEAHNVHEERFPRDRPEHPGDIEPLRRNAIALGADIAGLGASFFGQLLNATPIPSEIVSLVSLAENEPRFRRFLEHHLGLPATDLGLGLTNALAQALGQGPSGLLVDIANRSSVVAELYAYRKAWERKEPELAARYHEVPIEAVDISQRSTPLPSGPVERYADRAAFGSIAAFGAGMVATRNPRLAANAFAAGLPKAARLGREAFAAHLGRELAGRDVVVLDSRVLRRLDRIDVVVLDGAVLATGKSEIAEVKALGDADLGVVIQRAYRLFNPDRPQRTVRRGRWALGPPEGIGASLPRGAATSIRTLARSHQAVLVLAHEGTALGIVCLHAQLDPLAQALAASVRRAGLELVVAGTRNGIAARLNASRSVAGGSRLKASIGALQGDGHGVMLVCSGDHNGALELADCSVGISGGSRHHPWGADFITGPGLGDAHLIVEAIPVARQVSNRSVALSLAGSGTGALWAMVGPSSSAGRRASLPVNMAALLAQANGALAGVSLGHHPAPPPQSAPSWHAMDPATVMTALGATEKGLDAGEAARRRPRKESEASGATKFARALMGELANPLTPILGVGAALSAAVGSVSDAALVAGVMGANALIGGVQRIRTEASLERLLRASITSVKVRRSGEVVSLERSAVVRGDLLELSAGDVVPADCRILEATGCEVDESALTGESFPVLKQAVAVPSAAMAERTCMLYEGSTVVNGEVLAVVVATDSDTELGRALAEAPEPPPSGVEARLRGLTKATVPATVLSGAAVTGLSLLHGRSTRNAVTSGVSLMVAAVPEGMPLLATVAQLGAARRLSTREALVRNPKTIEALGRVDLLCFDKTGTLTAGRIALQRVSDGVRDEAVGDLGPKGRDILAAALRASPEPEGEVLPHATDQAVVEGAALAGITAGHGLGGWEQLSALAFEPVRGYHAVVGSSPGGSRVSVKGAPEAILPRCDVWRSPAGLVPLTRRTLASLHREVERLARRGLRVLAVAERPSRGRLDLQEDRVVGLELLGFLGLADLVRPTAAKAIEELRRAGVDVVMITGDHPSTAEAIAAELGILNGKSLMSGGELESLSDLELDQVVGDVSVFARITPALKMRIVGSFQRVGRTVAMTGDGANDAPAIRLAHVGIALGGGGSPAAREAADLVVTDDRIETIIDAIVEGRAMWASVRDALAILVGGNLGEVAFTVGATAISGTSPLQARQLLLVNLLTDLLPAMTIALRVPTRLSPEQLIEEGPDASLGRALAKQIAMRAVVTAAGAGSAWLIARPTGSGRRAGTVSLVALVGTQLAQTAVIGRSSPVVLASTVVSGAALAGIVQTPGISQFFGCTPLGPLGWTIAVGSTAAATGASVVAPWVVSKAAGVLNRTRASQEAL